MYIFVCTEMTFINRAWENVTVFVWGETSDHSLLAVIYACHISIQSGICQLNDNFFVYIDNMPTFGRVVQHVTANTKSGL